LHAEEKMTARNAFLSAGVAMSVFAAAAQAHVIIENKGGARRVE